MLAVWMGETQVSGNDAWVSLAIMVAIVLACMIAAVFMKFRCRRMLVNRALSGSGERQWEAYGYSAAQEVKARVSEGWVPVDSRLWFHLPWKGERMTPEETALVDKLLEEIAC